MLESHEIAVAARAFGVSPMQVGRDHLISHLLLALANGPTDDTVVFYGGTALARTHLPTLRLSEDIDLWAHDPEAILSGLQSDLPRRMRREYPDLQVSVHRGSMMLVQSPDGSQVRLDVRRPTHEFSECIPSARREVVLRYSDLPRAVSLTTPTIEGFVATKHLAWVDRHAPRDLIDLGGLAGLGALTTTANDLVECVRGFGVATHELAGIPDATERAWQGELGHQMASLPEPEAVLKKIRDAWGTSIASN